MTRKQILLGTKGIITLSIVLIAALSVYLIKKSDFKSQTQISFDTKQQINFETKQQENTVKIFNLLIDLACVFKDFNDTVITSYMANKEVSIDDFVRKLIRSFTATEVKFQEISKELKSMDYYDQIIRDIAEIASNASGYSRRNIDIIFMIQRNITQRNQNDWEVEAIRSRITEEWSRDWSKLSTLVSQFIDKHKQFLTVEDRNDIFNKITSTFKYEYDLFYATCKTKGLEAALDLSLPNGGWLPMTMLLRLFCKEL